MQCKDLKYHYSNLKITCWSSQKGIFERARNEARWKKISIKLGRGPSNHHLTKAVTMEHDLVTVTSNDSPPTIISPPSPPPAMLLLYRLAAFMALSSLVDDKRKFFFSHPPTPVGVLPSLGSYWLSNAAAAAVPSSCVQLCCLCLEAGRPCVFCLCCAAGLFFGDAAA